MCGALGDNSASPEVISCAETGRYVTVSHSATPITICELKVMTWLPVVNVAVGKSATQSSDHLNGDADRAVDGNVASGWHGNSCSQTLNGDSEEWWQVDLGEPHDIITVNIYHRTGCATECGARMLGATVSVSSTPDYTAGTACGSLSEVFGSPETAMCSQTGQYVTVSHPDEAVAVCEVQVMAEVATSPAASIHNAGFLEQGSTEERRAAASPGAIGLMREWMGYPQPGPGGACDALATAGGMVQCGQSCVLRDSTVPYSYRKWRFDVTSDGTSGQTCLEAFRFVRADGSYGIPTDVSSIETGSADSLNNLRRVFNVGDDPGGDNTVTDGWCAHGETSITVDFGTDQLFSSYKFVPRRTCDDDPQAWEALGLGDNGWGSEVCLRYRS